MNGSGPVLVWKATVWSSIALMVGTVLSVIVPWPCASAIVALTAAERLTKKVSAGSGTASAMIGTETVFAVSPGVKVTVPFWAV